MTDVSLLLPLYNTRPEILHQALASVDEQTYPLDRIQVCVYDDGSAPEYKEGYQTLDLDGYDVEIVWSEAEENRGLSHARNRAASNADGEYYLLLDSDDVLDPRAVEVAVETFEDHPNADLLYSDNVKFTWPDLDLYQFRKKHVYARWLEEFKNTRYDPIFQASFVVGLLGMRAETFDAMGGYTEEIDVGEDIDFLVRAHALAEANTFVHVPDVLYFRRHSEESLSRRRQDELHDNSAEAMLEAAEKSGLDVSGIEYFDRLDPYRVSHYFLLDADGEPIVPPYVDRERSRLEGTSETVASLRREWKEEIKPRLEGVLERSREKNPPREENPLREKSSSSERPQIRSSSGSTYSGE